MGKGRFPEATDAFTASFSPRANMRRKQRALVAAQPERESTLTIQRGAPVPPYLSLPALKNSRLHDPVLQVPAREAPRRSGR